MYVGEDPGQDATINPYAKEDYSYALVENIGTVEFQIRIESIENELRQFLIKPSALVVIKLYSNFDALTTEKV